MLSALIVGDGPAILAVEATVDPLTFGALRALIESTGARLAELGVNGDDLVCSVVPNGPVSATSTVSIASHCRCAPISASMTAQECAHELSDGGADFVIIADALGGEHAALVAAESLGIAVIRLTAAADAHAGAFTLHLHRDGAATTAVPRGAPRSDDDIALVVRTSDDIVL